ncbi:MAG TPA: glycosyltransferase 61 family protein [Sulfuriferula sp.]|nr:glycosyltransferase 61 family protein [Sulfuriferula sp.]
MKLLNRIICRLTYSIRLVLVKFSGDLTCLFLGRKEAQIYRIEPAQTLVSQKTYPGKDAEKDGTFTSFLLHPESSYTRAQPKYTNSNIAWSSAPQAVPPLYLYSIPIACVSNLGVISTFDGNIIAESAEQFISKNQKLDGFVRISKNSFVLEKIRGAHIFQGKHVLLTNKHIDNYGHFILECLPNARLLNETSGLADAKVVIHKTENPDIRKSVYEVLALAGVEKEQIVEFGGEGKIGLFEVLLYPSPITNHPAWKSNVSVIYCEQLAKKISALDNSGLEISTSSEYLYVSRSAGFKRRPTNEGDVIDLLVAAKFTVIYPERMSVQEQIVTFSRAKIIVGILGAAMTNIIFSPQMAQIIMFTPDSIPGYFFWDLASLKKQGYYALSCKTISQNKGYGDADFYVDINELKEALAIANRTISNLKA